MSKMNHIAWVVVLAIWNSAWAADPPEIQIKAPKAWRSETIKLPPAFAPDMTLTGVEEIRFAPGMFQADSDSFFSYFLVFVLP